MTDILAILAVPLFLTYVIAGITVFADIIDDIRRK